MALIMNLPAPSFEPKIDVPGTNLKITKGMTKKQVVAVLGAPVRVIPWPNKTSFIYHNYSICSDTGCSVSFNKDTGLSEAISDIKPEFVAAEFYY